MLKEYSWRGYTWQFEESEAPADAVPLGARRVEGSSPSRKVATPKSAAAPKDKAEKPAPNKRRRAAKKTEG